jgi:ABC-type branched-subunit amino acid transport system substrate-binding protein/ABC-type amino acid transport substrate-binding protein
MCILALLLLLDTPAAQAQAGDAAGQWELRVCVAASDVPASTPEHTGFEDRIAGILARQLGARLTLVGAPRGRDMVRQHLWTGDCDVIMEVADGADGVLNTIPYYRTPFVFLYRKSAPFRISSLADDVLQTLRIGTYPFSIPFLALDNRGLQENLVILALAGTEEGPDQNRPLLEGLQAGTLDVAVVYGPVAGWFAQQHPGEWELVAVTPQIEPPLLEMYRTWTMGVRPGDESLRDRLDIALAQRWTDIQAVFAEFNVPLLPLPQPTEAAAADGRRLRIGMVLPLVVSEPALTDSASAGARSGALLAEGLLASAAVDAGLQLDLLLASAPDGPTAARAAQRLLAVEGVAALIGGLGSGQDRILSGLSEAAQVPFLNIGSPAAGQERTCRKFTFQVAASSAMYLDALAEWFGALGSRRWFFVYEDSVSGQALYRRAVAAVTALQGSEAGSAALLKGQRVYYDRLEELAAGKPDVVLVLLEPVDQEWFLLQYEAFGLTFPVTGFPAAETQTREFYARLLQAAPAAAAGYRVELWEPTLSVFGAGELNDRFLGRWGNPMDSSAWAAWAATGILFSAARSTGSLEGRTLREHLLAPDAFFDVKKGPGVSFRPWDQQLRQPLYVVSLTAGADWGLSPQRMLALASLAGEVPAGLLPQADPLLRLDQLGDGPQERHCP